MKLEIDIADTAQCQIAYDMLRARLGITDNSAATKAAKPASPPQAAAPNTPTPAATAAAPQAATTTAPASSPAPAPTTPSGSDTVDLPTATAAFQAFVKANGPAKAKAVMAEMGYQNLPGIPADQLGAFVARLQQPVA